MTSPKPRQIISNDLKPLYLLKYSAKFLVSPPLIEFYLTLRNSEQFINPYYIFYLIRI